MRTREMPTTQPEILVLGPGDVPRWTELRKRWLDDFLSVYGPMDKCPYHYPRPWIEDENMARSIAVKDQVFLGIEGEGGRLVAAMRVKKREKGLLIEGFHPRVLKNDKWVELGSRLLSWCLRELQERRVRRVVSRLLINTCPYRC